MGHVLHRLGQALSGRPLRTLAGIDADLVRVRQYQLNAPPYTTSWRLAGELLDRLLDERIALAARYGVVKVPRIEAGG